MKLMAFFRQVGVVLLSVSLLCGPAGIYAQNCAVDVPLASITQSHGAGSLNLSEAYSGTITSIGGTLYFYSADTLVPQGSGSYSLPDNINGVSHPVTPNAGQSDTSVFVARDDGVVTAVNLGTQTATWSKDLTRSGCSNDSILAAPVANSLVAADRLYVGTHYESDATCTSGHNTQNKVYALVLDPMNGSTDWEFNGSATVEMDVVSGMVLDDSTDILYVATERTFSSTQSSVWAIDVTTGTEIWSVNANRIQTKPILRGNRLYVATAIGSVTALNTTDGSQAWSLTIGLPFTIDPAAGFKAPFNDLIAVVDLFGRVRLIRDNGASGTLLWTSELPIGPTTNTGFAPIKATSTPLIDDYGYLYVGASDGKLYQLDIATGDIGPTRVVDAASLSINLLAFQTSTMGGITPYSLVATSGTESDIGGVVARYCAPFMYPPGTFVADGDINTDGSVNAADVLLATQATIGSRILNPVEFGHGDVSPLISNVPVPDGEFNLSDTLIIIRKALGQISF